MPRRKFLVLCQGIASLNNYEEDTSSIPIVNNITAETLAMQTKEGKEKHYREVAEKRKQRGLD